MVSPSEAEYGLSANQTQSQGMYCWDLNVPKRNHPIYYPTVYAASAVNILFSIFAVVGNSVVLIAFRKTPSLRTPSNGLLCGLAVSDLVVGLVTQPSYLLYRMAEAHFWDGLWLCDALIVIEIVGAIPLAVSGLIVTAIAIERLRRIQYRTILTRKQLAHFYFAIFCFETLNIIFRSLYYRKPWFAVAANSIYFFLAAFCGLTIFVCYCKIFALIRQHQTQVNVHAAPNPTGVNAIDIAKYKKSISTMLVIVLFNIISYLPLFVSMALAEWGNNSQNEAVLIICATVMLLSSSFNPLIYCWRIREIRVFFKHILKKLGC